MSSVSDTSPNKPARPVFNTYIRGKSYLEEHQQYRSTSTQDGFNAHGIDSIVESTHTIDRPVNAQRSAERYNGVPSTSSPPKITESNISHMLSHSNCQPPTGEFSDRIIATLLYKSSPRKSSIVTSSSAISTSKALPTGLTPARTPSEFPLEPPSLEPEPLDHLYGTYISQLCLTSFLNFVSTLPLPKSTSLSSSHRCLDTPVKPKIVELTFSPAPDPTYLSLEELRKHELLYNFEREWNVEVVLQRDTPWRRYPRLVVFDMDSTLIREEVIDLIAASIGVEEEVSAITERAMNGELDFNASLKARVALLKGVNADIFTKLRSVITPNKGAALLIKALKRLGVKTAVLSGGFIPLTSWLAAELGIDYAYANTLESDPMTSKLTGVLGSTRIINAEAKAEYLLSIAKENGIDPNQTIAIGDGANDLKMMAVAGMGVAFCAKPVVQMQASARLNGGDLLEVLYLLGFTKEEIGILTA